MTDNEIIKALECCKSPVADCDECTIFDFGTDCQFIVIKYALDLINRQQSEIDRLKNENEILSKNADTAFQDGLNEVQDLYAEQIKDEIKSEAIKEFAESLNEKVENARKKYQRLCKEQGEKEDEIIEIHFKGIIKLINNLVKEYEK